MTDSTDEEGWLQANATGRRVVWEALVEKAQRRIERGSDVKGVLGLGLGGHQATVEFILECATEPETRRLFEEILIAGVRCVCRGAQGPINEDGSPYEYQALPI